MKIKNKTGTESKKTMRRLYMGRLLKQITYYPAYETSRGMHEAYYSVQLHYVGNNKNARADCHENKRRQGVFMAFFKDTTVEGLLKQIKDFGFVVWGQHPLDYFEPDTALEKWLWDYFLEHEKKKEERRKRINTMKTIRITKTKTKNKIKINKEQVIAYLNDHWTCQRLRLSNQRAWWKNERDIGSTVYEVTLCNEQHIIRAIRLIATAEKRKDYDVYKDITNIVVVPDRPA